ncbi:hypothetical protein [Paenibacillus sp. PL2-23]|uniref:lipase/acyltransferase domain-containing protein n=1 Tax=Paenibacillus sp. PL2-23 TaxID=2100729 RepID=UPI0030FBE13A
MKRIVSAILLSATLLVQTAWPSAVASPFEQKTTPLSLSEQEPNNSPDGNERYLLEGGESFVFTGDVSGRGYIDDPIDYYSFQAKRTGYMSVKLQETATANLMVMDIVDESGNEMDNDHPNHLYEIDNVRLVEGHLYHVRVSVREDMVGSEFHYLLQVGFQAQPAPVDTFEPNDARESAALTTLGQSPAGKLEGTIDSAEDQDWYQFETTDSGYYNLHLHNVPEGVEYDFQLYNSNGEWLASTKNRPGKIMYNVHGSRGQTFFVQVYASRGYDPNDTYVLERTFTSSYNMEAGDMHEWNNSLQTASITTLGQSASGIGQGTIHVAEDQDWYAVELAQSGNFQVGLALAPTENYHIALYEADGDALYSTASFEEHEPKMLPYHFGARGDVFYVKVFTEAGYAAPHEDYEIEWIQIGGDSYEPNNTKASYTPTKLGQSNGASISATLHNQQDVDWYSLSAYTTGYFAIDMNRMPLAGYAMKLYDESMQEVGVSSLVNGKPQINDVFGKKGQPFYLKVYTEAIGSASPHPYEITMYVGGSSLTRNESESNDSFHTANMLKEEVDMLGSLSTSEDRDYFKFQAGGAGKVHFALEGPADRDYNLVVYDEDKKKIGESRMPGNQADYVFDVPVNNNEVYAVVYPAFGSQTGSQGGYRLKTFYRGVATDSYENNDTMAKATEASVTTGYPRTFNGTIHAAGDVDFYKVTNNELPYDLQLSLTGIPVGANYDISLFDNENNLVALSKNAANKDESISIIIPKNKTYYIKVFSADGGFHKDHAYQLTVKNGGTAPIIIVPGFGGTALFGNDPTFFGMEINLWMNLNIANTAKFLRQNYYSSKVEAEIGAHFRDREAGLWDIADVAPEYTLGGDDEYFKDMIKDLKAEGYVAGRTLFGLPYNFLRDNTEAAEALKKRIDLAIEKSGSSKVMLISHSNGGLVIKEAVYDPAYEQKVGKWVTLGTPWLGAAASMKAWIDGYDLDIPILPNSLGRELAMHSPSAYGLLPSDVYFRLTYGEVLKYNKKNSDVFGDYYPVYIEEYDQMADFLSKVNDGPGYLDFQERLLEKARYKHMFYYDYISTDIPLYIIFGDETRTIDGYTYDMPIYQESELADNEGTIIPLYVVGDGTVPLISSRGTSKHEVGTNNTTIYRVTGVTHMPLVKDERNRLQVKQILIFGNEDPVADLSLHARYNYTSLAYEQGGRAITTATAVETADKVTATVFAVPLKGAESVLTVTLKNGEQTIIRLNADNTYSVDKQAADVTIDSLGSNLWISTPVDQGTTLSWTGASLDGTRVYDLRNGVYLTSYEVQITNHYKAFTVINSVAQPNPLRGVHVEEKPVHETGASEAPAETY